MALRAVQSQSLADQVFEQLAAEIITNRYETGAQLPAERALAELFQVNRHVVREALKRLEQVGLVESSQGGGTKVLDFKREAGLDTLALMAEHARGGDDVAEVWLSVLEMRAAIGADAARLCALRADRSVKAKLIMISNEMAASSNDPRRLFELEVRYWDVLIDGSGNLAYRFAFNSLMRGMQMMGSEVGAQFAAHELKKGKYRAPTAAAIAAGDAKKAEAVTRDAMRSSIQVLAKSLPKAHSATPTTAETPKKPAAKRRRS